MKTLQFLLVGAQIFVGGAYAASADTRLSALPLSFEPNRGQTVAQVRFVTHVQAATVFLTDSGAVMRLPQGVLEMRLEGARKGRASGLDPLPGRSNYLVGDDRARWHTDIPTFGKVRLERIYSGIDLVYHGNGRNLESDFLVSAGADPAAIRLAFRGQRGIRLDADGSLVLTMPEGELRQHRPVAYQETGGERRAVECVFRLDASGEVGFAVGPYNRRRTLVIDPVLAYSGRLGGSGTDWITGVALDSAGNTYVVGSKDSVDFPITPGSQGGSGSDLDIFITKINAAGTAIVYSTYVGGNGDDHGYGIAVDSGGNAWITGESLSSNFPWLPAVSSVFSGFVVKVNARGDTLNVSTPIGDQGYAIAVDSSDNAYVTGATFLLSSEFPVVNAVQPTAGEWYDAWVAKFSWSGAIVYATFLGGGGDDHGYAIAVDGLGSACVAGDTYSTDFPTSHALQSSLAGSQGYPDAFVTKLTPSGNAFVFSTYLGGSQSDTAKGVAMDSSGNCYVAGQTGSTEFPTLNAAQGSRSGTYDAFVTAYSSTGSAHLYSTYLGGTADEEAKGIAVTPAGVAWVTGATGSPNLPVTADAYQPGPGGGYGGVLRSVNSGANWNSLMSRNSTSLAISPSNPLQVYAGTDSGMYRSTDGGSAWNYSGLARVIGLAMNPANPCSLYAIDFGDYIYSSGNCGGSWSAFVHLISFSDLKTLAISGSTLWAASDGTLFRFPGSGSYNYWQSPLLQGAVLAVDPASTCTLYLGDKFGNVFKKSACGGDDWPWPSSSTVPSGSAVTALAVHPTDHATVLAGTADGHVYKKAGDGPWTVAGSMSGQINSILFHPANPSNVYVATVNGLVYASTDGAASWGPPVAVSGTPSALAAGASAVSTVHLASIAQSDAFLARLNTSGAITYASYLGGRGSETGYSVAVEPSGVLHVAGQTNSSDFPVTAGVFPGGSGGGSDGFLARFDPGAPVSITVKTSPAGLAFSVDGVTYTSQQEFNWVQDSSHTVSVTSPQTGSGTRYGFANWSDGGTQTHTVGVPATAATYTANFTAQYLLTIDAGANGTVTANPSSADGYYASGTGLQLTATPASGYVFAGWSGDLSGGTNPRTVVMDAPHAVTASFTNAPPVAVTIATSPAGLSVSVDGSSHSVPRTFQWGVGTSHTVNVASPQGSGTRYSFASWSDGGAATHSITVPSSAATYTANFTAQHLLTVQAGVGGIVALNPVSADGYYNSGTSVQLTALPTFGYAFTSWGGDLSGGINPQSVVMNGLRTVSASFATAPVVGLRFVPVTPCRVIDTRSPEGPFGGPTMVGDSSRAFPVPQSGCGIPATAQAYSLNVTVVPKGSLSYLSLWPTGQTKPLVSTLNSFGGIVVANAAVVPAGAGGAISIYVTNPTDVIVDINGYFATGGGDNAYSFYPAQPCRVADTRRTAGPFGGPNLAAQQSRDFAVPASGCGMPAGAKAYSLNVTVVPDGYLGYLTTWPAGQAAPLASTLNSWTGKVVANAALVPAGASGAISVYASNPTAVILDTNGYFAAPGSAGALSFYPVTPCRVADTRGEDGTFGGPKMEAGTARSFPIPTSGCGIPSTAAAYSVNVTVVPDGMLSYLTTWPTGASQPGVSTLNSWDGTVVANAAIVPAGTSGAISVYVTNRTHVILDINGYFAP